MTTTMNKNKTPSASKQAILNNYLELAREFQSQQLYSKAEDTLKLALEVSPNNPRILTALVNLYLKQGWLEQAQEVLQKVLRKHKDFKYAYYLRGKLYEARGNINQAIKNYRQALAEKAGDAYVLRRLIPLLLQRGHNREALDIIYQYRRILKNPDFMTNLEARALVQMGERSRASTLLRELVMARPDVKHYVYQYLKTFVENSRKSPKELYQTLRETTPGLAQLSETELNGLEVEYLINNGKLEEALELIDQLIARDPHKNYWKKRKAFLLLKLERQEAALPLLKELFLQDPTDMFVRSSLESYYLHRNKIREWKELLKESFTLHPNRMELFGLIRRASLHQDWLSGCQLSFSAFRKQVQRLSLPPLDFSDHTFKKLPLYAIENFTFFVAINDTLPDAETLWQFIRERKGREELPFQMEDLANAMPVWIFGMQFYFLLKQAGFSPQFVPARLQKDYIAATFVLDEQTIFLEIKNMVEPPRRPLKPLRKTSGGFIWRLTDIQPEQQVSGIPFFTTRQFRQALNSLKQQLRKE